MTAFGPFPGHPGREWKLCGSRQLLGSNKMWHKTHLSQYLSIIPIPCSALGSLQLLEPILAISNPSGNAQLGTDCPGGEILARPQRGHNISDTLHSLSEASSFFVFHTEAQQFCLEKARKEAIWANPVLSLAQPSFLGNQACCLLYSSCVSLKLSCH